MNLLIKAIFYMNGGTIVEEGVEYAKRDESVTDESFKEDVENIAEDIRNQISEGMITDSGKIIRFGNTIVRFADISAYQIIIETIGDALESALEEDDSYIYMNNNEYGDEEV